jgi:hypothetical protein
MAATSASPATSWAAPAHSSGAVGPAAGGVAAAVSSSVSLLPESSPGEVDGSSSPEHATHSGPSTARRTTAADRWMRDMRAATLPAGAGAGGGGGGTRDRAAGGPLPAAVAAAVAVAAQDRRPWRSIHAATAAAMAVG